VSLPKRTWSATRLDFDYELLSAARRVIDGALAVVRGERVLIVHDGERLDPAKALHEAVRWASAKAELVNLDELGSAPLLRLPEPVKEALTRVEASVFIARGESAELPMRRELLESVNELGLRHAHMSGITAKTMTVGLATDPQRIANVARALRARLHPRVIVTVRSAAGTELTVRFGERYRWFENSGVIRAGRWRNLPAGELLTTPADVEGVYVANASVSDIRDTGETAIADPIRLELSGGRVTGVSSASNELESAIRAFLEGAANQDRVGMVGFGTNVGLSEASGALLVDQTLPGLHLCLGTTLPENTGAEWDAPGQLVLTAFGSDIDLDGEGIVRGGRYLVG
jgi:leucyl aminopeptidase (aminopeptidase T)